MLLEWLAQNRGTLVALAVVCALVALAIASLVRGRRKGGCAGCAGCGGCGGECGGCENDHSVSR